MADARFIIFENIVPSIGVLLFILMAASPTRAVWRTRRRSDIGEFNPLPTVVLVGNAICWNAYAIVTKDPFITVSSSGGLLVAICNTIILVGQARQRTRDRLLILLLTYITMLLVLGAVTSLAGLPASRKTLMWGIAANTGSVLYYTAPLSTALKVVRQRDSSSIHVGNAVMSVVNCSLWIVYFVAKGKVIVPTMTYYLAICFNSLCLWLCWRYPRRKQEPEAVEAELPTGALAVPPAWSAEAGAPAPSGPGEEATAALAPPRGEGGPTHRARGLQRSTPPLGLARISSREARLHAAESGRAGTVSGGGESTLSGEPMPPTPPATHMDRAASGLSGR